jgi:uncharacterized protein (UPF0276 family)
LNLPSKQKGSTTLPDGAGIGLRTFHHHEFARRRPDVGWIEVHTENVLGGGPVVDLLFDLRRDYPVSLHGVGLSLGSAEGLDATHLARIADLARRLEPAAISEHVSWSITGGVYFNDLIPLPYDREALRTITENVQQFQDMLGRQVMVENPSTYLTYSRSEMSEPEFLAELCDKAGCGLLLDVNNVFVSAENHGFDPKAYLAGIANLTIGEIHLSGHHLRRIGNRTIRIDDHGSPVADQVWSLYRNALELIGPRPTLIEWDSALPELDVLIGEAEKARNCLNGAAGAA